MRVEELRLALCLADGPCPNCEQHKNKAGMVTLGNCPQCQLTGTILLLEGVREKCPSFYHQKRVRSLRLEGTWLENRNCSTCQGWGWVPKESIFPYIAAYFKSQVTDDVSVAFWPNPTGFTCEVEGDKGGIGTGPTMEQACLESIAKALGVKEE